jgi:hypothetical protein
VLIVGRCEGELECVYYKTSQQFADDQQAAFKRLAALSPEHQRHIAEAYYEGEMPWLVKGGMAE